MMDNTQFKKFFSNLSEISKHNFVVWNNTGMLFSSETEGTEAPDSLDFQGFSSLVIQAGKFTHAESGDKYRMFGVPLRNGEEIDFKRSFRRPSAASVSPCEYSCWKAARCSRISFSSALACLSTWRYCSCSDVAVGSAVLGADGCEKHGLANNTRRASEQTC